MEANGRTGTDLSRPCGLLALDGALETADQRMEEDEVLELSASLTPAVPDMSHWQFNG